MRSFVNYFHLGIIETSFNDNSTSIMLLYSAKYELFVVIIIVNRNNNKSFEKLKLGV